MSRAGRGAEIESHVAKASGGSRPFCRKREAQSGPVDIEKQYPARPTKLMTIVLYFGATAEY